MAALIGTVLVASLLGSLHCAGMCGAFVAFAVGAPGSRVRRWKLQVAYHGGRLVTYTLLGALSGTLGAALDLGGALVGVQRGAAILAGGMMVLFGLVALLHVCGARLPTAPVPRGLQDLLKRGHLAAADLAPLPRALTIGLLTTLLPCGWLYAFAVTAAGTASPLWGALTMAAFWVGTLPVLVSLGVGLQAILGSLGRRVPLMTSLALVIVGVWTVTQRAALPAFADGTAPAPQSIEEAAAHAAELPTQVPACCQVPE